MKRILVLSDSHRDVETMIDVVKKENPNMIIHLGDCWDDALALQEHFVNVPMEMVPGNCDLTMEIPVRVLIIEGYHVMICHGHTYNVKASYLALEMAAHEKEADVVLFGHTHRVFYDKHNGLVIMNPGSIGSPGYGSPASYGILTLDGKKRTIDLHIEYIE